MYGIESPANMNAFVCFDMEPLGAEKARLTQTFAIQVPSFVVKFLTDLIGGEEGKEIRGVILRKN